MKTETEGLSREEFEKQIDEEVRQIVAIAMCGIDSPLWETRQKVRIRIDTILEAASSLKQAEPPISPSVAPDGAAPHPNPTVGVQPPRSGGGKWSAMMATVLPCGHTNAQHFYHESRDFILEPCSQGKQAKPPSQPAESTIDRARRAWESWKIPGVEKWISRLTLEECMAIDKAVIEFWAGFADEYHFRRPATAASEPEPRDCVCPTVMDGPNYSLQIIPECPWHSRPGQSSNPDSSPKFQGRFCVKHKEFDCFECKDAPNKFADIRQTLTIMENALSTLRKEINTLEHKGDIALNSKPE